MEYDVSKFPGWVKRIVTNEDSILGLLVMWFLGLTIFPTAAFYIGTISSGYSDKVVNGVNIPHYYDLRTADMHVGGWCALGGLGLGICLGLWATFIYPKFKEQDAFEDIETADRLHHMLSHHDEIGTDAGQQAEHVLDHPTSEE